jgi:hypothetical protein
LNCSTPLLLTNRAVGQHKVSDVVRKVMDDVLQPNEDRIQNRTRFSQGIQVTSPYSYRSATMGSMWAALMAG